MTSELKISPKSLEINAESGWQVGPLTWDLKRPLVMGVLNTTPDSFSDGGDYPDLESALARAEVLRNEGADMIDIGGVSSHPSAPQVCVEEELRRVVPIIRRLVAESPLPISVDTQQPEVAEVCLDLGAHLINDVGGLDDGAMVRVAAAHDAPLVIMFNNFSHPRDPTVPVMEAMRQFFLHQISQAERLGVRRIVLDPGYGFGKSLEENLAILRGLSGLAEFGRPILVCTSRKGSLGRITGEKEPKRRAAATIASSLFAVAQGAGIIRVHDVREFRQALQTWLAIESPQPLK